LAEQAAQDTGFDLLLAVEHPDHADVAAAKRLLRA